MLFLKIKYITLIKIQDHNRSYTEHADANLHSSLQSKGLKYGSLKVSELYIYPSVCNATVLKSIFNAKIRFYACHTYAVFTVFMAYQSYN